MHASKLELNLTSLRGLDTILGGGLRPASIVLIEGLPGTGKTLLASQLAVRASEPVRYVSFESTVEWFRLCCSEFSWNLGDQFTFAEGHASEIVADPASFVADLAAAGIKRLVIDSLASIQVLFEDRPTREYREFLQSLFRASRAQGILTILVTETSPSRLLGETGAGPEQFLADTVITLRKEESGRGIQRSLEIAKSRGQNVLLGRHSFRIQSENGIEVFPRAYSRQRLSEPRATSEEKVPFGIAGLEDMLGGGVFRGSSTLLVGISGTGKTVAAMQFINEGLKAGETCLMVSLDDSLEQFCRNASLLGFQFVEAVRDGRLIVHHETPVEIELDAHFCKIEEIVRERECKRVVIDSLATYEMSLPKQSHEFLIALSTFLRAQGSTTVFAYECPELLGVSQISANLKASAISDNIVLLNYVEISTTLRRAITVPKTRGSKPDQQTREYIIKSGGIAVLDETTVPQAEKVPQLPLSCYYGVLARSPTRHAPLIDESVAAGKPMPKSKIPKPIKKAKADSASVN
jgi:circadian clock protein KaiC